ncbi:helix-turn-helix domain-containing protein [Sediminibacillus sp. JSM 1682029]|uniref:helix-turn-helix transcriptional regulator n=1 Tax=Sediminibacillus sp. JSM 1682029 TaxID=3229857 RepID=UPI003523D1A2
MDKNRLMEDRNHGDPMFPLRTYTENKLDSNGVIFGLHWHYEMEFTLLEKGPAIFQIGSSSVILEPGEAVLIPSGQLHAAYPLQQNAFQITAIVFHLNFLRSFAYDQIESHYVDRLEQLETSQPLIIKPNTDWEQSILHSLSRIIHYAQNRPPAYELAIKGLLFEVMAEWLGNYPIPEKTVHNEKTDQIKKVLLYIEDHFHEKIKIKDLACLVQMSEGHFNRFFKSIVRMTPIEYTNTIRINHAAKLLRETSRKILTIALDVGFDNQSYFIRTFKRYKKCTPSQFRKMKEPAEEPIGFSNR